MTYFSFQVINDIIGNYQRPPRIENNRVSKQLSSLEAESKKKKITSTRDIRKQMNRNRYIYISSIKVHHQEARA